jgi:hypothetical protein
VSGHFESIRGDAGYITAAAGAKVGIISKWIMAPHGMKPDGKPILQFKAQFSWKNDSLMNMVGRGALKGRVIAQMKDNKTGRIVDTDILDWSEWRLEGGVLILENVLYFENVKFRPI